MVEQAKLNHFISMCTKNCQSNIPVQKKVPASEPGLTLS